MKLHLQKPWRILKILIKLLNWIRISIKICLENKIKKIIEILKKQHKEILNYSLIHFTLIMLNFENIYLLKGVLAQKKLKTYCLFFLILTIFSGHESDDRFTTRLLRLWRVHSVCSTSGNLHSSGPFLHHLRSRNFGKWNIGRHFLETQGHEERPKHVSQHFNTVTTTLISNTFIFLI